MQDQSTTSFNEIKENLLEQLEKAKEKLAEERKRKDGFDTLKDVVSSFFSNEYRVLESQVEELYGIAGANINIALLGHYSHGKSSLINALFGIDKEDAMPVGIGQVTSKETLVKFDEREGFACAKKVKIDGSEEGVEISSWQQSVKQNKDVSDISYFQLTLPTSNKPFAKQFADEHINLIDLPGVGGKYWTDSELTSRYLREASLVLLPIKITEIPQAGIALKRFLNQINVGIIPVLTYFDEWQKGDFFAGCTDETVIEKAKKLILDDVNYERIHNKVDDIIAVSCPQEGKPFNIDGLREYIKRYVMTQKMAINIVNQKDAEVLRLQKQRIKAGCLSLLNAIEDVTNKFGKLIESVMPKDGQKVDSKDIFEGRSVPKLFKQFNKDTDALLKIIFRDLKSSLETVKRKELSEVKGFLDKLSQDVIEPKDSQLNAEIKSEFERMKNEIRYAIKEYLSKLKIDQYDRDEILDNVSTNFGEIEFDEDPIVIVDFKETLDAIEKYEFQGWAYKLANIIPFVHLQGKSVTQIKTEIFNKSIEALKVDSWKKTCEKRMEDLKEKLQEGTDDALESIAGINSEIKTLLDIKKTMRSIFRDLNSVLNSTKNDL